MLAVSNMRMIGYVHVYDLSSSSGGGGDVTGEKAAKLVTTTCIVSVTHFVNRTSGLQLHLWRQT